MKKGTETFRGGSCFTLIELLTVTVIIAILAAILLPALMRAKYVAQVTVCMNNMKQQALGLSTYASDNDLLYPQRGSSRNDLEKMHNSDNAWDIRPIMRGYHFGNNQSILECPLASNPDASANDTNYNMYFTAVIMGSIGGLGSKVYQYDYEGRILSTSRTGRSMTDTKYYLPIRGSMRKVGQSWRYATNYDGNLGKRFNLLLSDRAGYGNGMGQGRTSWSNHKGFGGPPPGGWVPYEGGWSGGYGSFQYPAVEGNFLGNDGHVEKHRMPGWGEHRSDFTIIARSFVPYSFLDE